MLPKNLRPAAKKRRQTEDFWHQILLRKPTFRISYRILPAASHHSGSIQARAMLPAPRWMPSTGPMWRISALRPRSRK